MKKVFIDGASGTTGLRIHDRLAARNDIELITLAEKDRKDPAAITEALNASDLSFLCLPDDAAREAVTYVTNPETVILDTSTAHRTMPGWTYGFPELSPRHRAAIASSKRIAVPGCHASGFIVLIYPLIEAGLIAPDTALTCFSLTGYSGGGKKMIAQYEAEDRDPLLDAPRQYGISQQHKHLKEMVAVTGLDIAPVFCPIVDNFYSGMEVTVPLFARDLRNGATADDVRALYRSRYNTPVVRYMDGGDEQGFLSAGLLTGKDSMTIGVFGNEERILLSARYDNLGKGASGAAVQCMNIAMGADMLTGLEL